ncbi:hypothetical protein [Pseudonocardia sp. TRM90224]|uniref:hypothetical protein n=1 Tax=Pseudonocardia sp. TRM90224 TaxID=2812678 RepID=UPI001E300D1D|nr:hypothetical protein [Pseudonocardia sp. TRM90224]
MRPVGVLERIRDLQEIDRQWDASRPDQALRAGMATFFQQCGMLAYYDCDAYTPLMTYREVVTAMDDPSQSKSASAFESRALRCVKLLHPHVFSAAARVEELTLDEALDAREPLVRIVPEALLGEFHARIHFDMVAWVAANALAEDIIRPYRAARRVLTLSVYKPDDPFGIIEPLTVLVERYEDVLDERNRIGVEITELLRDYLIAVG